MRETGQSSILREEGATLHCILLNTRIKFYEGNWSVINTTRRGGNIALHSVKHQNKVI